MSSGSPVVTSISPPSSPSTCSGRGDRGAARRGQGSQVTSSVILGVVRRSGDAVYPVEGAGEQRDELEIDAEEEAEVIRSLPTPTMPTRSEFLDHCVTHHPYRAWCKHCIEGRGREFGHSTKSTGA